MRLSDFEGEWRLSRVIDDRLAGRVGRLDGRAAFRPEGGALVYREEGVLRLPGQPPLTAAQSHVWRDEGALVAVFFADGRPFHRFDPSGTVAEARHDCAPDLYLVRYDFGGWPVWSTQWTVAGPRKDQVLSTRYRRT